MRILFGIILLAGCHNSQKHQSYVETNMEVMDREGPLEILSEIIDSAKDEYDVSIVRLWSRNTSTGRMNKLLETVRNPEVNAWYLPDGKRFIPVCFDSIPVASSVKIWKSNPLQLIVSGCPDMRNEHSFLVDIKEHKAWWIPSNRGFIGDTEEGFMIFQSYRYVSYPERGGRYTFLQIFNEEGEMVDSLNLEHHHY